MDLLEISNINDGLNTALSQVGLVVDVSRKFFNTDKPADEAYEKTRSDLLILIDKINGTMEGLRESISKFNKKENNSVNLAKVGAALSTANKKRAR